MSGGSQYEYQWQDPRNAYFKTPRRVSAPKYVDLLMDWTETIISNKKMFPASPGMPCSNLSRCFIPFFPGTLSGS